MYDIKTRSYVAYATYTTYTRTLKNYFYKYTRVMRGYISFCGAANGNVNNSLIVLLFIQIDGKYSFFFIYEICMLYV